MSIQPGSTVKIKYVGLLENGIVFDSSGEEPFTFQIGDGSVIKAFEDELIGMNIGDKKEFKIDKEHAHGPYIKDKTMMVKTSEIPKDINPKIGDVLSANYENGKTLLLTVLNITEDYITLDLNHPLAGKDLIFRVEVVDIQ
jgi:peptidylprolyl isomerase